MIKSTCNILILVLFLSLCVVSPTLALQASTKGTILSLTATDAPGQGDTIVIASTVRADTKIANSNLYYVIFAPDNVTVVATHTTILPKLEVMETFNDSWSTTNASFPSIGTYTVDLCWSTGGSQNCDIDQATTTFYSVPTLGPFLGTIAALMIGLWLWKRRSDFNPGAA